MKTKLLVIVSCLFMGLVLSCREDKVEERTSMSSDKSANARRACANTVSYAFVKPDNDYTYNGDGCQSFYIHRGSTRQVKVKMANTSGTAQTIQFLIAHPDDPNHIQYTVASYTGGSIAFISPVPGTSNGAAIRWTGTSIPAYTTYELTLNITGVIGSSAAENGLQLIMEQPCTQARSTDCDADDVMHVVLTN